MYSAYQRQANIKNYALRRRIIEEQKKKPCADCGASYPHFVMDFDHVRGVKEFTIGTQASKFGVPALHAEIAKCDVVCSNCHRFRTFRRNMNKSFTLDHQPQQPQPARQDDQTSVDVA